MNSNVIFVIVLHVKEEVLRLVIHAIVIGLMLQMKKRRMNLSYRFINLHLQESFIANMQKVDQFNVQVIQIAISAYHYE